MKRTIMFILVLVFICSNISYSQEIKLVKLKFDGGEEIKANFNAPAEYPGSALVALVPAGVAHGSASETFPAKIAYLYLNKSTTGILVFKAPKKSGSYDLRMFDNGENGKEVASITFEVGASLLRLTKTKFASKEDIRVEFTAFENFAANAWIGIVPSDVPHGSETENDKHDMAYQYLNKKLSGTLIFKAPIRAGTYDLRMNDSDNGGKEIASITFEVIKEGAPKGLEKF